MHLDDSMLGVEQLDALSRAIPDDDEREQLRQYLEGKHPKHMVRVDVCVDSLIMLWAV